MKRDSYTAHTFSDARLPLVGVEVVVCVVDAVAP